MELHVGMYKLLNSAAEFSYRFVVMSKIGHRPKCFHGNVHAVAEFFVSFN